MHINSTTNNGVIDRTGDKYGRLVAVSQAERIACGKKSLVRWFCQCDCGNTVIVRASALSSGNTKSCGCLSRESFHRIITTHGLSKTRTCHIWRDMLRRCNDTRVRAYSYYGARGITVCTRWRESFENFLNDMGECPSTKYSIDRIDNDAGYSPENCRWATSIEQHRNTRHNHLITYENKTQCLSAWAEELGTPAKILNDRIVKLHWPIERAFTEPIRKR